MEGLIPLVYRTLKKTKTRRQYECLSSGASQAYNIADFHVQIPSLSHTRLYMEPNHSVAENNMGDQGQGQGHGYGRGHHRRRMSMGDVSDGMKTGDSRTPVEPKIMRFRSHRMFSCVTGC